MSTISAADVKKLRDLTGSGMMECKKALVDAEGDFTKAQELLAISGNRKADKTASRTAAQGVIVIGHNATRTVMLDINCETDFVARDNSFLDFANKILQVSINSNATSIESLNATMLDGMSVEEQRKSLVAKIGEKINLRRIYNVALNAGQHSGYYVHGGRIGVVVMLQGGNDTLAKDLAMHIAAINPAFIAAKDVDAATIEKEKVIFIEQAKESGKPDNIIEKMIAGRISKFLSEICLVEQPFVKDQDKRVADVLKEHNATVISFVRFEVGEGIEVIKTDFAAEVMAQVNK